MPFTERAGHRIWYSTFGDPANPPLLLIMGLAVSSQAWDALPLRLADRFHVITFDNCGTGRSASRKKLFTMIDLADDAEAVLRAAGVERANVFGISMGGMIAQELALRHPARVRALVLGATYSSYLLSAKPGLRSVLDLAAMIARSEHVKQRVVGRLLSTPEFVEANPGVVTGWFARSDHARIPQALAQMWAILRHHTYQRLDQIACPTLVISGDQDRLVPAANSHRLVKLIAGARLEIIPGAGHVFPLEREAETVRLVTEHCLGVEQAKHSA
ncbi:MAG TPA: alpha/beta fold hydrolase [Myxococcales bacterium]|nr:alpha/beta fold hydrolase [Myxococcales bacterium]